MGDQEEHREFGELAWAGKVVLWGTVEGLGGRGGCPGEAGRS